MDSFPVLVVGTTCAAFSAMVRLTLLTLCLFVTAFSIACVAPADGYDDSSEARAYEALSCLESADCATHCDGLAQQAVAPVAPPSFERSRCELAAIVAGDPAEARPAPSCLCIEGDSEDNALLLSATGPDPCVLYGRDRSCLYETGSFPGCDLSQPETSCEATCDEVQRRLEVDAVRTPEARVRSATCAETGCHCVLEINGACYVDDWLDTYDCRQGDEAILDRFESFVRTSR